MNQTNELIEDGVMDGSQATMPTPRTWTPKGLPEDAARKDLARTYIEIQRRLWPDLVRAKVLPGMSAKSVALMADSFRDEFLAKGVPCFDAPPDVGGWKWTGAAYLRYSCDNSNPRSLDQQLKNILERAAQHGVFVPWAYVFADAAVSGTTAARRGYQMTKSLVKQDGGPHVYYVDEMGRASRDAIETLTLGRLIATRKKRLVGVTDSFDSDEAFSQMKLQIFAMVQEWFVGQLRSKVLRGMGDGFARGMNLGKAALGYKLTRMIGPNGQGLVNKYGQPVMAKAIDDTTAAHVLEAFRLYAVEGWSKGKIARHLNELKAGGMTAWDGPLVNQLLNRETYFGVEYYRMSYREVEPETGLITIVRRPRKDWMRRDVPHLRIVPPDLEAKAKERLEACRAAYRQRAGEKTGTPGRTDVYPKTLVRPMCGYCGNVLYLGKSGKYASFCCSNGVGKKNGCRLRNYKAVKIVEQAVIGHVRSAVFTPEFVADLVDKANAYLRSESDRPKEDVAQIRAEIKTVTTRRDRLLLLWEEVAGELNDVVARLKTYQTQLASLQARLREAEGLGRPVGTITAADVEAVVADLHALLREDTGAVAPVLRALTGPVTITLDEDKARKRATEWVARFAVNLVPVAALLTRRRNCPTSGAWEYLKTRGWTTPQPVELGIRHVPKYEMIADRVRELADGGAELVGIATAVGETYDTVQAALRFAQTGERPATKRPGRRTGTRTGPPKYQTLASDVARLRDEEFLPFPQIARRLGMGEGTARRAYDLAHKAEVTDAVSNGQQPDRGRYVLVPVGKRTEIAERLARGEPAKSIAEAVGCSENTVRRIARGAKG